MRGISVIIPTFNCARFLHESVRSVLDQTVRPTEIVIVDDGSEDGTSELVQSWTDARIRYVYQSHAGVSAARNKGIECAKGEFISFLDADDRWLPTMLCRQLELMNSSAETVCCFTNFVRFDHESGAFLRAQFSYYPELEVVKTVPIAAPHSFRFAADPFSTLVSFGEVPSFTQAMMFRADGLKGVTFDPKLRICEDTHFVLRIAARGEVAFTREILAEVRRHDSNVTNDLSRMAMDKVRSLELIPLSELDGSQR